MTDKRFIKIPVEEYEKLKQECEALQMSDNEAREIVAELNNIIDCKNGTILTFKEQLDQLKAEFDKKELIFAGIETSNRLLIEKNNKLKQTLTEIKEIANENIRIADSEGLNGVYRRGLAKQILQKIDEVLDDRQEQ